ncbi:MAG: type II toxin-antitoxin system HicA family toxin [Spirochaetales bacterium]|nr:type II toxin-antitoxin system HicA family toxin [Spirochaetales bacterium]
MAKSPRMTAVEAEKLLLKNGFEIIRIKGSHKVFFKKNRRVVVPYHSGKVLHPKIVKQVAKAIGSD